MTTYNTRNPVGSSAAKDLYDNAQNLDHRENDRSNETWDDRLGVPRLTWFGIEKQNQRAIAGYGYITMDSFQAGATLTLPNQVLRDTSTGEYYRWDGAFPKVVPAGSTPSTAGGVANGAWVSVGDASLRANLGSSEAGMGASLIALLLGGNLQQAIDSIGVYPESFGTAYDDVRLQAAMNYAAANGKRLVCTGRTFILNAIVSLPSTLNADFTGSVIIAGAAITSGSAIMVQGDTSIASGQYSGTIHNLLVLRPLTDKHPVTGATVGFHADTNSNVDGVSIGKTGAPQGMTFYNLRSYGFRDGLRFDGPNAYINHFYMADIGYHWRRGIAVYASVNSNENLGFTGGRVFNVNNLDFNGAGVYIDPAASKTDMYFGGGMSFDYNDIAFDIYQSYVYVNNCHIEGNNNNPFVRLTYTSGKEFPSFFMSGGDMAGGPGGTDVWTEIPVEQSGGRDAYIYAVNAGGVNVTVHRTRVGNYSVTNPRRTQLLKVQGNNPNILNAVDLKPVLTAGNTDSSSRPIRLSNAINSIVVSQYTLDAWTQTLSRDDGTITFSIDTSVYYDADSPHSRKYVGTNGYSTGLYQEMACSGGQMVNINVYAMLSSLTAGYQALRIDFLDSKGNVVSGGSSIKTNSEVTTTFKQLWVYMKAPNGAVKVRVQEYYNAFTGTGYFSLENAWVH